MSDPKEFLQGLSKSEKVPVVIGGMEFKARSRLTVEDVMALPHDFMQYSVHAKALVFARLLLLAPNGMPFLDENDNDWFNKLDGFILSEAILKSQLMPKVFKQLEEKDENSSGKKSPSRIPSETSQSPAQQVPQKSESGTGQTSYSGQDATTTA